MNWQPPPPHRDQAAQDLGNQDNPEDRADKAEWVRDHLLQAVPDRELRNSSKVRSNAIGES